MKNDIYRLNSEESKHIIRVLRMKSGDSVRFTDGKGFFYDCEITDPSPKACQLKLIKKSEGTDKRPFQLHIAIAPTKNISRFEWFLEKATEIGVDEITPILCERSERKHIRHERSGKILLAAMKQSGRAYLPKLNPFVPLHGFLQQARADKKLIAHCEDTKKNKLKEVIDDLPLVDSIEQDQLVNF